MEAWACRSKLPLVKAVTKEIGGHQTQAIDVGVAWAVQFRNLLHNLERCTVSTGPCASRRLSAWVSISVFASCAIALTPQPAVSAPPAESRADIEAAVRLRSEFGLPTEMSAVRAASASQESDTKLLGIPLSPNEAADIRARNALVTLAGAMSETLATSQSQVFGGVWIDQKAGGVIHLAGTQAKSQVELDHLSKQFLHGSPISYDRVEHSLSSLEATRSTISTSMRRGRGVGKWALQVSVREKENRVRLRVVSSTPRSVTSELERRYGNLSVEVTPNEWLTQSRDRPTGRLFGGLWINSRFGITCTSGFSNALYGDRRVTVTAGHCGDGPWFQGISGKQSLGNSVRNFYTYGGAGACDCQVIGTLPNSLITSYVATSNSDYYKYLRTATSGNYVEGTPVCLSGAQYPDNHRGRIVCAEIIDSSASIRYSDRTFTLTDAVITNIIGAYKGDSGGPYGNGPTFMGIHSAAFGDGSAFYETAFTKSSRIGVGIKLTY